MAGTSKDDGAGDLAGAMEDAFASGMAELTAAGTLEGMEDDAPALAKAEPDAKAEPAKAEPEGKPEATDGAKGEAKGEAKDGAKPAAKAAEAGKEKAAEAPPVDPYEGTTPLTLTVDGRPVAIPELLLADGGALVPPDKLQPLQERITRGIQAEQAVARMTEEGRQSAHVLAQLSHTVGEDTYQGLAAFEAMKAESAAILEGTKAILGYLNDPTFVHNLAFARQTEDAAGVKALIQQAIEASSGAYRVATATGLRAADRLQLTGPPAAPIAPEEGLARAVDYLMSHESLKGLAPEDRAAALRYFGPFAGNVIRAATAEEAAKLGLKPGDPVAEYAKLTPWFEDRLAWRKGEVARAANTEQQVNDRVKAEAFNNRITRNRQSAKPEAKPAKAATQPRDEETGKFKKSAQQTTYDIFAEGMAELNLTP